MLAEVTHITANGVWILTGHKELFMPYDEFPLFKDDAVSQIIRIEEPQPGHFYWPELDVYLTAEIIEH